MVWRQWRWKLFRPCHSLEALKSKPTISSQLPNPALLNSASTSDTRSKRSVKACNPKPSHALTHSHPPTISST